MLIGIAAVAVAWADVVHTLQSARPAPSRTRPSAIVWGDRVFGSPSELRRWLRSRGASYADWASRHASTARVIDPTVRKRQAAVRHGQSTATVAAPPAQTAAAAPSSPHLLRLFVVLGSLVVGLLCLLGAVAPRFQLARLAWPELGGLARYGSFLVAAGSAILVGLLIAFIQG